MKHNKTKLIDHRKVSGMSQRAIAKCLGVSPSAVCHIEKTGIRSIRVARKYARVLHCDPLELID